MSNACCQNKCDDLKSLAKDQANVLWIVLFINAFMFIVESFYGYISHSMALTGDSLDMLGDSLAYGSSIMVLKLGNNAKARASQFKAILMIALGLFVFGKTISKFIYPTIPTTEIMTGIGTLALVANLICLALLYKHKNDDINFTSVWICSRNDIIANLSVIFASFLILKTNNPLPDLIVGLGITFLFLKSSIYILKESKLVIQNA